MSGCDSQLISHTSERGTIVHVRALWFAIVLSLVVHIGAGFFAGRVVMEASGSSTHLPRLAASGPVMTLDFEPPPDEAKAAEQPPPPTALANTPEPKVKPPEPEPVRPLRLGIADSDQKSPNWLGFKDPTEHTAPKSEVEQPALDPNAGRPGEPTPATPPAPPAAADPLQNPDLRTPPTMTPAPPEELPTPTPPVDVPTPEPKPTPVTPTETPPEVKPAEATPPTTATPAPTTAPGDANEMIEAQAPKLGDPNPAPEPPAATAADPNDPALSDGFVGPLPRELVALLESRKPRELGVPTGAAGSVADRAREAANPRAPTPTSSRPAPAQPTRPPTPGGPATTATRPAPPSAPSGNNADRDAELSEKQADATSLTQTIDIRPGRPAASQGLDIITRRPNFTRLTRVVAYPDNPLLKVTFSRAGQVVNVVLVESSGASDIDDPVINAVYQWTARGKALDDLAHEHSTLTVSVRIILR